MRTSSLKSACLGALCLAASWLNASATMIVDTGTPDGSWGWSFYRSQYFGAQFTVSEATVINSIEGYFSNDGAAGLVTFALHANGSTPGAILFSEDLSVASGTSLGWQGLSSLNWNIAAGTYWVSFLPDVNINGIMPGFAPNPLDVYVQGNGSYNWYNLGDDYFDYLGIGVRIDGTQANSVPDDGSILAVWVAAGILGIASRRRLLRSAPA
jgi:hypothetical protein